MDNEFRLPDDVFDKLSRFANLVIPRACELDGRKREGGILAAWQDENLAWQGEHPADTVAPEQFSMFTHYALEKGFRLIHLDGNRSMTSGYDPAIGRFSGAVRFPGYILSFSGLRETMDEAICLVIACLMKWTTLAEVDTLLEYTGNDDFYRLADESSIAAALALAA